jgi:aminopeptidase N
VVITDQLYPGVAGLEWLVAHEVAHQWWFGVVGGDQIDEPWLDEALTQYSTMLYYEKAYGAVRATRILQGRFIQTHQNLAREGRDMPAGLPVSAYGPDLYWQVVYDKGALYFHGLRQLWETRPSSRFFRRTTVATGTGLPLPTHSSRWSKA